jgi:DNA modification methylase
VGRDVRAAEAAHPSGEESGMSGQPYYQDEAVTLWHGDSLAILRDLPSGSVDCCVTSPPYFGLRDYGVDGQLGAESSPAEYVENMRALFAEVRRVLADDGTLWLNLGDSYSFGAKASRMPQHGKSDRRNGGMGGQAGLTKPGSDVPAKNLIGVPWRVAFAIQADGWILRNDIIWHKRGGLSEAITDRLAKRHEHVFMLSKAERYHFDLTPIREPLDTPGNGHPDGRNPGDVWSIATQPYPGAHFAVMPSALAERCILAGCKPGGTVLDPFSGSGTTGLAAAKHGRRYVGIDLNAEYLDLSPRTRLAQPGLDFGEATA